MISSIQVELYLRQLESRIIRTAAKKANFLVMCLFSAIIVWLLAKNIHFFSVISKTPHNGGGRILRFMKYSLPTFIIFSLLGIKFRQYQRSIIPAANLLAWTMTSYFFFHADGGLNFGLILFFYPIAVFLGFGFMSKRYPVPNWSFNAFIAAYLLIFIVIGIGLYYSNPHHLWLFLSMNSHYLIIQIILIKKYYAIKNREVNILLAPTFAVRGLILPQSTRLEVREGPNHVLWWHGMYNIVLGLIFAIIRNQFNRIYITISLEWLKYSSRYVLAILGMISFLNVLTGILRINGFSVLDATNFVIFSRSPREFWRRGSVYSYVFIRDFIYFPLLSKIHSVKLSYFTAFFVFITVKIGIFHFILTILNLLGISFMKFNRDHSSEYTNLIHWVLWIVVMEFMPGFVFRRKKIERPLQGWLSILLTHTIMSSLYWISHLIYLTVHFYL